MFLVRLIELLTLGLLGNGCDGMEWIANELLWKCDTDLVLRRRTLLIASVLFDVVTILSRNTHLSGGGGESILNQTIWHAGGAFKMVAERWLCNSSKCPNVTLFEHAGESHHSVFESRVTSAVCRGARSGWHLLEEYKSSRMFVFSPVKSGGTGASCYGQKVQAVGTRQGYQVTHSSYITRGKNGVCES